MCISKKTTDDNLQANRTEISLSFGYVPSEKATINEPLHLIFLYIATIYQHYQKSLDMGNKKRRLLFSLQSSKVNGNQDSLVKTSTESNTLGRDQ
uniref:Uncharacterized protein n=1 Tax=Romanomermis culicivorax TaxID=13658 RepID=A0A915K949_ROMCU